MFIHNPFTIYLNAYSSGLLRSPSEYAWSSSTTLRIPHPQFHVDEQNKISPLGIKSYYHSTNEPIMLTDNDLMMFIHGRVFNLQQLNEDSEIKESDTEIKESDPCRVLFTIYKTYGIEYLLQVMQGEFVMVIVDQRVDLDEAKIYTVSESMGVIPLYIYYCPEYSKDRQYIISTIPLPEGRLCCSAIARSLSEYEQYTYPGTYAQFSLQRIVHTSWTFDPRMNVHTHYSMPRLTNYMGHINYDLPNVLNHQFYLSVWDRFQYDTTTTHVCCLYHESEGKSKDTSTEYNILYNDLIKVCKKKNMLLVNDIPDEYCETTRVFVVFGGCTTIYDDNSGKSNLQVDYELRHHLKTMVQTTLIPLYESFYQEHGIMLEFPWLNSEWLQLYLSLPYGCRFDM